MAIFAIPQVDAFIIALVLALFLWASHTLFGTLIAGLARSIPVVGTYIVGSTVWIDTWILGNVSALIGQGITPFGNAIGGTVEAAESVISRMIATVSGIVAAIADGNAGALATSVQAALDAIGTQIADVRSAIQTTVDAAEQRITSGVSQAVGDVASRIEGNNATLTAAIAASAAGLIARLAGTEDAVRGEIEAERARAEEREGDIQAESDAAIAEAERITQERIDEAAAAAAAAIAAAELLARQRIAALVTALTGVTTTVAELTPQVEHLMQKIPPDLITCLEELCHNVHPDVPNIQGAAALIESGLLLAYLVAAITKPEETAGVTVATVGGAVHDTLGLLGSLVGVRQ